MEAEATGSEDSFVPARRRSFLPDPGHLWLVFRRRFWPFAITFALIFGLAIAYVMSQPVLYSATATVVVEPRMPQVLNVDPVAPGIGADTPAIDTEVQLLSSQRLASRVAHALEQQGHRAFQTGRPAARNADMHPLAGLLRSMIHVRRVGLTYVIAITATSPDRQLAGIIPNEFARQYLAQQAELKQMTAEEARSFLQREIDQLRTNVVEADAALQRYKIEHGLMSAEGATMAEQEVSALNQEISRARADLAQKQGQLNAARSQMSRGGGGANVPAALQSGTVGELRRREAEMSASLAEMTARYGDRHPQVQTTREELAETRAQLQQEIDRVVGSLDAEVQAAHSRVASLENSQAGARSSLASNSSAQVGLLELERRAEAAQTIYTTFLRRAQEMVTQEGMIRPDARIEALARIPLVPSSPQYFVLVVLGLLAATLGGLAAIAVFEYLDARIRTKADIEQKLGLPYLGAVPELESTLRNRRIKDAPHDFILDHPFSSFAEAFRSLRASLMLGGSSPPKAIAVTSALPREGKSTTAICLARLVASSGSRAVLVDCDARRRSTSETLLPPESDGLIRYIKGECTLDEALVEDTRTSLKILGFNTRSDIPSDLFTETVFAKLLADLSPRFDVILLDTAPVLGIAETRAIAAAADAVVVLARWRHTSMKAAETAIDILASTGANLTGVALTLVNVRFYASTGQQDVYGYHQRFAHYYTD